MPSPPPRRAAGRAWTNWAGNQRCRPEVVVHPRHLEDIVEVVTEAAAAGHRLKVAGGGHSWSGAATTRGVMIRLDRHRRLLAVDRERLRVTVQAGMTMAELDGVLSLYGLALPTVGGSGHQTVAGTLATGTHGTGSRLGCLADQVLEMGLVTAAGTVLAVDAGSDPDAFSAARVSLGALAVVTSVSLQCVPAANLRTVVEAVSLPEALDSFDEMADADDHAELSWVLDRPWALVRRSRAVDSPPEGRGPPRRFSEDRWSLPRRFWGDRWSLPRRFGGDRWSLRRPRAAEYVAGDEGALRRRPPRCWEMEHAVHRQALRPLLAELGGFLALCGPHPALAIEVRVAAADDIALSMGHGRPSAFVAFRLPARRPYEACFRGVEGICAGAGGRPHWGKLHFQTAAELAPRYPAWDRFRSVRRRLDPEGRFANDYTDRVLGPVT